MHPILQWLPLLLHLITVVLGTAAALHRSHQEHLAETAAHSHLTADVQYIRQAVDDIRGDTRVNAQAILSLERRMIQAEDQLHHLEEQRRTTMPLPNRQIHEPMTYLSPSK